MSGTNILTPDSAPFSDSAVDSLSGKISRLYTVAKAANLPQHNEMVSSLFAYRKVYEPAKRSQIDAARGSDIYTALTQTAVNTLLSYFFVSYFGTTTLPFSLKAEQLVDIPEAEEAEIRAKVQHGVALAAHGIEGVEDVQGYMAALQGEGLPDELIAMIEPVIESIVSKRLQELQEEADESAHKEEAEIRAKVQHGFALAAHGIEGEGLPDEPMAMIEPVIESIVSKRLQELQEEADESAHKEEAEIRAKVQHGVALAAHGIEGVEDVQGYMAALQGEGLPDELIAMIEPAIESIVSKRLQELQEEADESAHKMETLINNQFADGGFKSAMKSVLFFMITCKAGILKAPILRKKLKLNGYSKSKKGKWKPKINDDVIYTCDSVHPLNFFPSPDAIGCNDGYFFERHFLSRNDLLDMCDFPGFDESRIRDILSEVNFSGQHTDPLDSSKAVIEDRILAYLNMSEGKIEGVEFWGKVRGSELDEWGVPGIDDMEREYEITAWMVRNKVIMALLNPDELGRRPYHKCNLIEIPDAFWGIGLPEILSGYQTLDNATHRAMHNNIAICGGLQILIDRFYVSQGCDITNIYPNKVWEFNSKEAVSGSTAKPIDFVSLPLLTGHFVECLNFIYQKVNEIVPSYGRGDSNQQGAASTASGLSMLMNANSRMIQLFLSAIDVLISSVVQMQYDKNMRYEDDDDIKGNFAVVVEGSKTVLYKSERINRLQQLLMATNNPTDLGIYGVEGRTELYKELLDDFNINHEMVLAGASRQSAIPEQGASETPQIGEPQGGQRLPQAQQPPVPQSASGGAELNVAGNPMVSTPSVAPIGGNNGYGGG